MDQLSLFAAELAPAQSYGMPPGVRVRWGRAMQPDVAEEVLAIARSRPTEWLTWGAFRTVIERHQIGFCFGQVLSCLVRAGHLDEERVYFGRGIGAEKPGSPNYRGFGHQWRAAGREPA